MRGLILAGLLFCGCSFTANPVDTKDNSKPAVKTVDEEFSALADAIDRGQIRDTYRLARVVSAMQMPNDWVSKFDRAFPDATTKQRELNAKDSATLREIR